VSARAILSDLKAQQLLGGQSVEAVLARISLCDNLASAVADADYVQESAPERLPIKQTLYREMARLVRSDAIIGSSTSGLPASSFTEDIAGRERCIVCHPINPPHLIPLVELVPAAWTDPSAAERTYELMRRIGQVPIRLNKEVTGFVVNRLQSAVLAEAFKLVEDGVCSVADVDAAVSDGLGLRWVFMGPFETIDLNAQGGVSDYCRKLGPMYYDLAKEQAQARPWSENLISTVEGECRSKTPTHQLENRKGWRDRCLAGLIRAKRMVLSEASRPQSTTEISHRGG
jgi:3-hydroxyacyl-CoA dehydrogenase